jgi:hypothetical protein
MKAGSLVATARAISRLGGTVGFTELAATRIPSKKSSILMFGPSGNPGGDNLLGLSVFTRVN